MILRILALTSLCGAALLAGCTRTTPPAEVEYDSIKSPYHSVASGESLTSIAQKFGMDRNELLRLNGLTPPYRIFVGQKLLVKTGTSGRDGIDAPATIGYMKGNVEVQPIPPLNGIGVSPFPPPLSIENHSPQMPGSEEKPTEGTIQEEAPPLEQPLPQKQIPLSSGGYVWPLKGQVIKGFKEGKNGNDGINISAPKGTPVVAANNGIVAHAGNQVAGLGNMILIKHSGGCMTIYAHLDTIVVKKGQQIQMRDKIGTVGKTGNVREPQLHFEIRKGKTPIDPMGQLN